MSAKKRVCWNLAFIAVLGIMAATFCLLPAIRAEETGPAPAIEGEYPSDGGDCDCGGGCPPCDDDCCCGDLLVLDYPCILKRNLFRDKGNLGCHYANATGAFVVEFEVCGLGDKVKLDQLDLVLTDIPQADGTTTTATYHGINTFTVTPGTHDVQMYEGSCVPTTADSNKYTLFVPQAFWQTVSIDQPDTTYCDLVNHEAEIKFRIEARVDGHASLLRSCTKDLLYGDNTVEVVELSEERSGSNAIDMNSAATHQVDMQTNDARMIHTHSGGGIFSAPSPLPWIGPSDHFLGINKVADDTNYVHYDWVKTKFVANPFEPPGSGIDYSWLSGVQGVDDYGKPPCSGLTYENDDAAGGKGDVFTATSDDKNANVELWPTNQTGDDVVYERFKFFAENSHTVAFVGYYRPIDVGTKEGVTGIPGVTKAAYLAEEWWQDGTGEMTIQMLQGWQYKYSITDTEEAQGTGNWNEAGFKKSMLSGLAGIIGDEVPGLSVAMKLVECAADWASGVVLPSEDAQEWAIFARHYQRRPMVSNRSFAVSCKSLTDSQVSTGGEKGGDLEISGKVKIAPGWFHRYQVFNGVTVSQMNRVACWPWPEGADMRAYCKYVAEGESQDFYKVDVTND